MDSQRENNDKENIVHSCLIYKANSTFELCDCNVIITVKNISYKTNREILASNSPFFESMFRQNIKLIDGNIDFVKFKEADSENIQLNYIDNDEFDLLLQFSYQPKKKILTFKNFHKFYQCSSYFQCNDMLKLCIRFLKKHINLTYIDEFIEYSNAFCCPNIKEIIKEYQENKFSDYLKSKSFLRMKFDEISMLLKSENLKLNSEDDLMYAIVEWLNYDRVERKQFTNEMLNMVRLAYVSYNCMKAITFAHIDIRSALFHIYHSNLMNQPKEPRHFMRDTIIIFGGRNKIDLTTEFYDCLEKNWNSGFITPRLQKQHCLAVLRNKIYIIGGMTGHRSKSSVKVYNPNINKWSSAERMYFRRTSFAVTVSDKGNKIYAIGGYGSACAGHTIESYSPITNKWSILSSMLSSRLLFAAAYWNRSIYIVGGICFDEKYTATNTLDRYDILLDQWTHEEPMQTERSDHTMTASNSFLFVIGGRDENNMTLDSVEMYDCITRKWSYKTPMPIASSKHIAILYKEFIYVICGESFEQEYTRIYNTITDEWKMESSVMESARRNATGCLIKRNVLLE